MKFNVLRSLLIPWFVFFILAVTGLVVSAVKWHLHLPDNRFIPPALGLGALCCVLLNLSTLSRAGIWLAYTLPFEVRRNSRPWLWRAVFAVVIAGIFYLLGQLPWTPLIWQAAVIPAVFTICLFVAVRSLMGPILKWSSTMSLSRTMALLLSLPVFLFVPLVAFFVGQNIVSAYRASRPDLTVAAAIVRPPPATADSEGAAAPPAETKDVPNTPAAKRAQSLREIAEAGRPCAEESREIQKALEPGNSEEIVYWAVKAVKCAEMKSVVALPKLVRVMQEHPSTKVRAAAILAMPKFGTENVRQVSYLLVKRLSEKEPAEVIEAAAQVLSRLPEDERKGAVNRLKSLLDSPRASTTAAKALIQNFKQDTVVAEFVAANLETSPPARERAVAMICLLPKTTRGVAEAHIQQVVAALKTGADSEPAMQALECLGQTGFQAIRQEVLQPQNLDRPVAARALAEMDVKQSTQEALETADACARDSNDEVRHWCSQSLGKLGAQALPKILDLLKSSDSHLKDAGKNALNFFDDPSAKGELERIRADNSGWMANQRKLQIARAIDTALIKIEKDRFDQSESAEPAAETAPATETAPAETRSE
ncbi:MAG: HEAT repeat domain-containing protein [Bdellovibrionaceae bacterium]|nr:HEAT repeat domain-containing protein [Pseudobdellovibrionaceae bacterium]